MSKNYPQATAPYDQSGPPPQYGGPQVQYVTRTVVAQDQFGPYPMRMNCHFCNSEVLTQTDYTPGSLTYVLSVVLFVFTCFCCCVPFCVNKCKDVAHRCPQCQQKLGLYKRM